MAQFHPGMECPLVALSLLCSDSEVWPGLGFRLPTLPPSFQITDLGSADWESPLPESDRAPIEMEPTSKSFYFFTEEGES